MSLFGSKKHIHNAVVFDIDSTSIAGGVFEYTLSSEGTILSIRTLYEKRKSITDGTMYPFPEFWRRTLKTFDEVALAVFLQSFISFDEVYVNVSAPWASSQKQTVRYEKQKTFEITSELIDSLVEQELETPLSKNLDFHDHKVTLIDRRTLKYMCDGYPVKNPFGKHVQEIIIESLVTVMSEESFVGFESIIEKHFHRSAHFIANTFVSYDELTRALPNVDDALILDVSGSMTEMFVVRSDYLQQFAAFPLGTYTVANVLAHKRKMSVAEAYHLIHMAYREELDMEYRTSLDNDIYESFRIWLKGFYETLASVSKQGLVNNVLVLKISREDYGWFSSLLLSCHEITEHMRGNGRLTLMNIMDARTNTLHSESTDDELALVAECIGNHAIAPLYRKTKL